MSKLRTLNRQAWGRVPGGAAGGGGEGLGYILAATRAGSRLSCPRVLIIQMFLWPGLQELCRLVASVRWRLQLHQLTTARQPVLIRTSSGEKAHGLIFGGKAQISPISCSWLCACNCQCVTGHVFESSLWFAVMWSSSVDLLAPYCSYLYLLSIQIRFDLEEGSGLHLDLKI